MPHRILKASQTEISKKLINLKSKNSTNMSRKAPKNYHKGQPKAAKTTATAEEERQARRVIGGIAIGLIAVMLIVVGIYYFVQP